MDAERRQEVPSAELAAAQAEVRGKQRSTRLVVLGLLLFFAGGTLTASNPDSGLGGVLFALLGIGLIVAGVVIRPRD